ncbi:RagB/SusD family nutrient uptake outer membrane protein [Aestuariibaculum sediminum]|uniref:RagB/SusD family nutrient uptake outer membrane protein n=1 Tax=Aestuariibaculum sediminum TaxID=2770637 RepID=A0A8J6PZ60_9FLAO|nr:RagB/SusD family nutrient uptake outer membrane protein [Aestuariibaculum sediminum]MBD0831638.1 RagB/SusD family nutrient uptake outer membrane protein [Aestuariibaculum sediminum]
MKIKNIIFTICCFFVIFSCDDKLDILPQDGLGSATLYQNEAGATAGLMGVYSRVVRAYRESVINAMYPSAGTDEGFENRSVNRFYLENSFSSNNSDVLDAWTLLYEGVNAANVMLVEVNNSEGLTDAQKVAFTAEARFIRAYLYFDLQRNFGGLEGIPLPTETTIKQLLPRTKGVDVYKQIISDLEYAEANLKDIQEVAPGRASKSAAQGLLARVCLYRAGEPFANDGDYYTKARDWAKKVMDNGYHELNSSYEDVFNKLAQEQYDTKEVLFQIGFFFGNQDQQQSGKLGSTIGFRVDDGSCNNRGFGLISATISLTDAYRNDANDERGLWNVSPYYIPRNNNCEFATSFNQLAYAASKYRRLLESGGTGSYGPHHWPVLRYADVLLMYAEAENQLNPGSTEALNAVNKVRNRAHATPITGTITTELIQEERRLELCFEGLRKYDLIRWGVMQEKVQETIQALQAADGTENTDWPLYGTGVPATRTNTLQGYYLDSYMNYDDSKHKLLPIPEQELGANDLVIQNPNW